MKKIKQFLKSKKGTVPTLVPFIMIFVALIALIIHTICYFCGVC